MTGLCLAAGRIAEIYVIDIWLFDSFAHFWPFLKTLSAPEVCAIMG